MKKLLTLLAVTCFTTAAFATSYCVPAPSSASSACSMGTVVGAFRVAGSSGTINDTMHCNGSGYLNNTGMSCTLTAGSTYNASVTTGTSYPVDCQSWIDFNDDSTFQTSESVGGRNAMTGTNLVTLTIPSAAAAGSHRLRFCINLEYGSGIHYPYIDPCLSGRSYYLGEGRDYTVTISGGSSSACTGTPSGGTASHVYPSGCGTGSTTTYTVSGHTTGSGITLQWQSSPTGTSSWTNITGETAASMTIATASTTTYYRCVITCTSSSMSANSSTDTMMVDRISGHIDYASAVPDTTELKVWLIYHNVSAGTLTAIDSMFTCLDGRNPYYEFNGMGSGAYLVKAKSLDYTSSTPGSSGYVPTYGSSNPHWSGATTVTHTSGGMDTLHITMGWGTVTSGPGFIGGLISSGAGKGTAADVPAVNMLVFLKNTTSGVITFTYTDVAGAYSFSNLANGNYIIYPEVLDYTTTVSATLNIASGHTNITGVNFKQYNNSKTIKPISNFVHTLTEVNSISVFPNPANTELTISWGNLTGNAEIAVADVAGRTVLNKTVDMTNNEKTSFNVSGLATGVYFVKVKSDAGSFVEKLNIQR